MAANNIFSPVVANPGSTPGNAASTTPAPQFGAGIKPSKQYAASLVPKPVKYFGDYVGGVWIPDPDGQPSLTSNQTT
jgi:hypothetical protein